MSDGVVGEGECGRFGSHGGRWYHIVHESKASHRPRGLAIPDSGESPGKARGKPCLPGKETLVTNPHDTTTQSGESVDRDDQREGALTPTLADLAAVVREHRIREKWLLAPSRRIGQQWIDRLALAGVPTLNIHLFTLRSLTLQLAAPGLAAGTAHAETVVDDDEAAWWLERAWQTFPDRQRGRLAQLPASSALASIVSRTLHDLRMAGLNPTTLRSAKLPELLNDVADKPRELADLWEHYERLLAKHQRCTLASLFPIAEQSVHRHGLPRDVLLLAPRELEQWQAERRLVAAAGKRLIRLAGSSEHQQYDSDLSLLPFVLNAAEAPAAQQDGSVDSFRAIGAANEVREVFRRLLAEGCRLDEVEILVADPHTYPPLLIELAQSWRPDDALTELPLTLASGIPAAYTRPGRALRQWLRWVGEGFPQQVLVDMYQEVLFDNLPGQGNRQQHAQRTQRTDLRRVRGKALTSVSSRHLARLLRETPVGCGKDRYLPALDRRIAALRARWRNALGAEAEAEAEAREDIQRLRARLLRLRLLRRHVKHLLTLAPALEARPDFNSASSMLRKVDEFLARHVRRDSRLDTAARRRLRLKVEQALAWLETARPPDWDARGWLESLLHQAHVHDQGPRPGAVHVSPLLSGAHSGRRRVFVLGLDDTRFPGQGLQDPVLLDEERAALSEALPLGADEPRRRLERLVDLFGRLPRNAKVTFSCLAGSLEEDREMFASPPLQTIVDLAVCGGEHWQRPVSFIPQRRDSAVTESEWWLRQLVEAGDDAVSQLWLRHPHYRGGQRAWDARRGSQLTRYSGFVPAAAVHLSPLLEFQSWEGQTGDPERAWSASAMETAGTCPLRFFFKYALRVRPPEELTADEDRWLDPLQFGSLMHEVFQRFMSQCALRQETPNFNRHQLELAHQLKEALEAARLVHPPPSESAFREQARMMQAACGIFLDEEERHCRELAPVYFEAAIGWSASEQEANTLQLPDPLPIEIGDGRRLLACGQVDRVDQRRDDPQAYEVWDYKTGNGNRYDVGKPFSRGQHVQNAFYTLLVQAALRQAVDPAARVERFGYFFPGVTSWGRRIAWPATDLSAGPDVLRKLADVMGSGAYLPTWTKTDCSWCDYIDVCGATQLQTITRSSATQAEQAEGRDAERLAAWKELQNVR